MKAAAFVVCLLAAVVGGVAHRLMMNVDVSLPFAQEQVEVRRSESGSSVMDLAKVYLNEEDDVVREQMLASLTAAELQSLAEELNRQNKPLHEVLYFWVETDVQGLLSFMARHPLTDGYWGMIGDCFQIEPEGTLSAIERLKSAGLPPEKLNPIIDQAFEKIGDPQASMIAAEKHGFLYDKDHLYRLNYMVKVLAKLDPKAAVALGERFPEVLDTALNAWSVKDPEAVVNWMRERLGKQLNSSIADSVLGDMAQLYPESADQYLAMAGDKEAVYRGLASGFKGKSIEELTAWLDSLPEEGRSAAYEQLCSAFRLIDRGKAAALCMTFPELAKTENSNNAGEIIVEWAEQNPVGALKDYQAGKIPPAVADKILPQIVESLFLVDRSAAMAFVHAQPDSEQKGVLLLRTSRILQDGDRASALDFALQLPEPASRLGACRSILSANFYTEPDGPKQDWIASIPDVAIREALLKSLEPATTTHEAPTPGLDPFSAPFAPDK